MKRKWIVLLIALLCAFSFASSGYAYSNEWVKKADSWYYYGEQGELTSDWLFDGRKWFYLSSKGVMQTGWLNQGQDWYYLSESGAMVTGWEKVNHKWYFFQSSGAMKRGWLFDGVNWFYLSENGDMQTGWIKDGESWYYLSHSGNMARGWKLVNNQWYFFSETGEMQTGWAKVGNKWYHLSTNGSMDTDWKEINSKWYYFYKDGSMASDTTVGNYYITSNGEWIRDSNYESFLVPMSKVGKKYGYTMKYKEFYIDGSGDFYHSGVTLEKDGADALYIHLLRYDDYGHRNKTLINYIRTFGEQPDSFITDALKSVGVPESDIEEVLEIGFYWYERIF